MPSPNPVGASSTPRERPRPRPAGDCNLDRDLSRFAARSCQLSPQYLVRHGRLTRHPWCTAVDSPQAWR
jgi:hypothetical protein